MGKWTGSWISGPAAAGVDASLAQPRGVRLGLPAEGTNSVASMARRAAAFFVDLVLSALVALLFTGVPQSGDPPWSTVVFVLMYVFFTGAFGQTPGMRLLKIYVRRLAAGGPLGAWRSVVRTLLLCLLIPAVVTDRDGRGLHDKAAGAVVLNA